MPWVSLVMTSVVALGATTDTRGTGRIEDPYPKAAAAYAVVVDDHVLWGRNLDTRRAPASLTKLMTALVLLERDWQPGAVLTISARAASVPPSRLGLNAGESLSAQDALAAMLIHSANDACTALVEHFGTGFTAFSARMNVRARQLGMRNTHFVQPCGFDADGQYSSVKDLLRLARAAYREPRIAQLVAEEQTLIHTSAGRELPVNTTNMLLGSLDGVVGLKTGYTRRAGLCLIALASRPGHQVWLVLLGAPERWWTAHQILYDALASLDPRTH